MSKQSKRHMGGSGEALPSGAVGEVKTAYAPTLITPAASTTTKEITSISLTPGVWLVSGGVALASTNATFTRIGVQLTTESGLIGGYDDVFNNNYLQQSGNVPNTQVNTGPKYLVLTTTTTIFLQGRLDYSVLGDAKYNTRSGIQAVRIA